MQSTPNPKETNPHGVTRIAPEVVVVARADHADKDKRIADKDKESPSLAPEITSHRSDRQTQMGSKTAAGPSAPPLNTTFRPAAADTIKVPGSRPSIAKRAIRFFIALVLAVCGGVAAAAWQSYGDTAIQTIASWAPRFVLTLSPTSLSPTSSPPENLGQSEQPNSSAVQAATVTTSAPQPAPPAQSPQAGAPTDAAALPPESAQLLQSMAHDLATVAQDIAQLKTAIEQLKLRQEQMSRDIAKVSEVKPSEAKPSQAKPSETRFSEQNPQPKISAPSPRPAAAPTRKPKPPFLPQAALASRMPQAATPPLQLQPQPQVTSVPQAEPVPRPPLPLR